jgi:katanin p60 ATPase-containing subunit A1
MAQTNSSTLVAIKASSRSKEIEERVAAERQRDCLVLIFSYLTQSGFLDTASTLERQARTILSRFEKADNIDLPIILSEFETYYEMKTGRRPKFCRRNECQSQSTNDAKFVKKQYSRRNATKPVSSPSFHNHNQIFNTIETSEVTSSVKDLCIHPNRPSLMNEILARGGVIEAHDSNYNTRTLKPLPSFDDPDMKNLAASIQREILETSPNVQWDDIIGLDEAKRLIKEAIVMPIKYPALFQGPLLQPWQGLLLFGQPGTGKTLLAKAVATETNTTFFNISASSITSKFRGESEKLIRVLFYLARYHAPSTIFFDEIDAIMGHRSSSQSSFGGDRMEHEGSRRMKTEILIEMDGLGKEGENRNVFVLCATNLPWDIDTALLRRLDKKILVPPPDFTARTAMIANYFSNHVHNLNAEDFGEISSLTESYTGADIKLLCKEAAMRPIRTILEKLETTILASDTKSSMNFHTCGNSYIQGLMSSHPITKDDVVKSLKCTKPSSSSKLCAQYETWSNSFGSL